MKVMFCLDYALAFFSHSLLSRFFLDPGSPSCSSKTLIHFPLGAMSGLTAAVCLYPFDIVRMTTVGKGASHFAFSTIPFMSMYLGVYFIRDSETRMKEPFMNKICWATAATGLAAVVELPFDTAKININGGNLKSAAMTSGMRIPLGALLLIAYDQVVTGIDRRRLTGRIR